MESAGSGPGGAPPGHRLRGAVRGIRLGGKNKTAVRVHRGGFSFGPSLRSGCADPGWGKTGPGVRRRRRTGVHRLRRAGPGMRLPAGPQRPGAAGGRPPDHRLPLCRRRWGESGRPGHPGPAGRGVRHTQARPGGPGQQRQPPGYGHFHLHRLGRGAGSLLGAVRGHRPGHRRPAAPDRFPGTPEGRAGGGEDHAVRHGGSQHPQGSNFHAGTSLRRGGPAVASRGSLPGAGGPAGGMRRSGSRFPGGGSCRAARRRGDGYRGRTALPGAGDHRCSGRGGQGIARGAGCRPARPAAGACLRQEPE